MRVDWQYVERPYFRQKLAGAGVVGDVQTGWMFGSARTVGWLDVVIDENAARGCSVFELSEKTSLNLGI